MLDNIRKQLTADLNTCFFFLKKVATDEAIKLAKDLISHHDKDNLQGLHDTLVKVLCTFSNNKDCACSTESVNEASKEALQPSGAI